MKKLITVILAIILCFALSVSVFAGTFTAPEAKAITLDGVITEEEWGAPIMAGVNKASAMDGSVDPVMTYWDFDPSYGGSESFDLYVNNDAQNIYLGLVVNDTVIDPDSTGANLWQCQNFTFTFSTSMNNGVPAIDFEGQNYEQYTGFRIGMLADGSCKTEVLTQGIDALDLTDSLYKVVYDEANKTMTYEVAVPYVGFTNVDLNNSTSLALSAVISLPFASNGADAVNGSNRFLIGTGAAFCGGPGNYAHNDQTIIVTLNGADAVAAVTPIAPEEPEAPEEAPEEEAPAVESEPETTTKTETTTVIEIVERELVWNYTTQIIIIIASGAVVVLSIIVILLSLKKKKAPKETPSEE